MIVKFSHKVIHFEYDNFRVVLVHLAKLKASQERIKQHLEIEN